MKKDNLDFILFAGFSILFFISLVTFGIIYLRQDVYQLHHNIDVKLVPAEPIKFKDLPIFGGRI
jgi:hypothetical protein